MADYTHLELKAALKSLVETVPDIGIVIIDSRLAEEDSEVLTLIQSLHPQNLPHGVNIVQQRLAEAESDNGCEYLQTIGFAIQTFRPYQRRHPSGVTSEVQNAIAISLLAAALRGDRSLGLDNRVRHMLLQSTDDAVLASFEGTGADTQEIHFGRYGLDVQNSVFV